MASAQGDEAPGGGGDEPLARRAILLAAAAALALVWLGTTAGDFITRFLIWREDVRLMLFFVLGWGLMLTGIAQRGPVDWPVPGVRTALAAGLATALAAYAGHRLLLGGYPFVIDEQLADFDAWIYAHGRLAWPVAAEWRADLPAFNTVFMLPVEQPVAWVSSYLPVHAALRALIGLVADPSFTAPLMSGIALVLLWAVARRLWPDDRPAAGAAMLLLVGSGQFWLMGMTMFAMAAHLAFNLGWLWLFLRRKGWADAGALLVGFLATGLHQPLFHPLAAAPFILLLLTGREWRRAALYIAGYALICGFWLAWPLVTQSLVSGPGSIVAAGGSDYWSRLVDTLGKNRENLPIMAANLGRFVTWQHLLLVPLMIAAWRPVRAGGIAAALALSVVLPIAMMTLILPWQGFGFGYRYLHPVLGHAALLAVFGLRALGPAGRSRMLLATGVMVAIILPRQLILADRSYRPYEQMSAAIDASGADAVLIAEQDAVAAAALVFNRPDLSNRPLRLFFEQIPDIDRLARQLCRGGATIALPTNDFYRPAQERFRVRINPYPEQRAQRLAPLLRARGCTVIRI